MWTSRGAVPARRSAWPRLFATFEGACSWYRRPAMRVLGIAAGLCVLISLWGAWGIALAGGPRPKDPLAVLRGGSPAGGDSVEPAEGQARTSLFGLVGEGFKFVYVFDRSGSMGGSGRHALQRVKEELRASLRKLDTVHQFQIIFYNDRPVIFNPSGAPGRLAFATEENIKRALRFIDGIIPDGGTEHEAALKLAIRLRPDVIFFLTDGDDPQLSPQQIERLSRMAAGITIHTIELGSGPRPAGGSFLAALAANNGGKYVYVDISAPRQAEGTKP